MKKTAIWLATAVVGILLSSCMGFEQTVGPESFLAPSVSLKQVEVSSGTLYVTLTGEVSGKSTDNLQCGFYFGKNSDLSDASKLSASMSVGRFSTATPSLEYETTYYYKAFISNGKEEICSSVGNFKTGTFDFYAKAGQPYIVQDSKGTVSVTSAVTVASGIELTAQGICYGKDSDISISSDKVESGINKDISVEIKNLDPGTTYFFRAYLTDGVKLTYSDVVSFVPHTLPVIVTEDIRDITSESAVSGGLGLKDNGKAITEKGLVWGTEHAPTVSSANKKSCGDGVSSFSVKISGLKPATTYYVRAYAINADGVAYGDEKSFTTKAVAPTVTTSSAANVTATGATVGGNVTSDGGASVTERGVVWSTSQNPTTSSNKKSSGSGTGSFTAALTGLSVTTTYYVRAYAINSEGTSYGEQISFTTGTVVPGVTTGSVSNVTSTTATVSGNVTSDGGSSVTERGVVWSTSQNPTTSSNKKAAGSGTGSFATTITGLSAATTYYVRAYAINASGTSYGEEKSFTTKSEAPGVTTGSVSNVTSTTATVDGNVTSDGGSSVTERGVVWSTSQNPTTSSNKKAVGSGTGSFTADLTGLSLATTYYVRAYAINATGTSYGEEISFKTGTVAPSVTTGSVSNVTSSGATVGGDVTSDGGASVTERGVVWSTSHNPTTSSNKKAAGSGTSSFTAELTGLKYATTYYVRAYAINASGTSYGEEKSFTTKSEAPGVTTGSVSNVTSTTATVGGNVTSDGGASVTERGVVWSTSQNPTTSSNKKAVGSGTGSFATTLTGLSVATTYYVRAYAINSQGTSYGEEKSFTTKSEAPGVTTGSVSNVTSTTATVGGNVTSDGGSSVTERGVVWSTSQNPTTSSNKKAAGSGTGSFTAELTGLSAATTYYVRAYAINASGTSYGEEKSFTTKAVAPTVTTSAATGVTSTTATVGGNVTSDGGSSVTERGVVWSTSQNPTTSSNKKAAGSGTGSFSAELTGLSVATTYYVRAYAVNSEGTSYGEEVSFKTGSIAVTSVSLSLSSLTLKIAESYTLVATVLPADATDKSVAWTSSSPSVAIVSSTGQVTGKTAGACVISVKSVNGISASCTVTVRPLEDADTENVDKYDYEFGEAHEYVDLGLSVKWATCNLGASKPEEYGGYYQWAGTKDVSSTSIYLDWSNCPYHTGSSYETGWTKYNTESSYGTVDNKMVLDSSDDAAHVNWGGKWRMPTRAEWIELRDNCNWIWTTQNGVNGYKVTSKKSGYTSKSIFLPASGYRDGASLFSAGSYGGYWSSSLYTDIPAGAWLLYFTSGNVDTSSDYGRYGGRSVRPVTE